jgi:hypothetical protein
MVAPHIDLSVVYSLIVNLPLTLFCESKILLGPGKRTMKVRRGRHFLVWVEKEVSFFPQLQYNKLKAGTPFKLNVSKESEKNVS